MISKRRMASQKWKVLMVEDDRKISDLIKALLEIRGCEVLVAPNLADAVRFMEESTPDVVLMDIDLPDGSGIDLCRAIRERSYVPIIFVTGLGKDDGLLESGFDAGGDDYMTKPADANEIIIRIEANIRRTGWARETAEREGFFSEIDEEKFATHTATLNKREKEVARLVAMGWKNNDIADKLYCTAGYIKNLTTRIYLKTGKSNRAELRQVLLKETL